ncbi:class I SAM-dependent methyltransferase [Hyunsoonleella rubra]|uniref:RsmD family RNA methyltransferase n=1 Tax=Hyunsoonleella rubra TaxID=1737062 RepID=A0ABW5THG6_9FLAO
MNKYILNTEIQDFINSNIYSDISTILLKGTDFENVSTSEIVEQIEAKKRCHKKLPTWFETDNIYFPNKLNIEQTSSEITAKYKSELIHGNSIIDITGGFGVDCFYFSKRFKNVSHCEINKELSSIVKNNFEQLNIKNTETIIGDGLSIVKLKNQKFDWVYIDPSRRHDTKGKVFFLKDCLPNVPENLDFLFEYSENILIKTSPLLDISVGINELKHVKTVHVVAVNNDVKELLWILKKGFNAPISIETANIKNSTTKCFSFRPNDEKGTKAHYSKPLSYLYEPNAAILKSGGFNQIAIQNNVFKLHPNSHLYTNDAHIDFPGRVFKIEKVVAYNKKQIGKLAKSKANVSTRNFPESVKQLRKKFNIEEGGDIYMFFTTDINNSKIVLITSKSEF